MIESLHFKKYIKDLFVPPKKQIPVLDGVRTLAILLVVGLHSNVKIIHSGLEQASFASIPPFQGGWVGVPLFFILSGFFIGTQLWREFENTGSIKVGRFILRRGMRIWPLYYSTLLFSYFIFPEKAKSLWGSLLFIVNYTGEVSPIRGAWSLSTEEQFYLIIPTLIFLCARFFKFKDLSSYRKLLLFLLILPTINRAITWYYLTGFNFFDISLYRYYLYRPFHTHFDGLIVGLLISNALSDKRFKAPKLINSHFMLFITCILVGVVLKLLSKVVFTYFALAIIFGSFTWMLLHTNNIIHKTLSWKPFYWTAKVSFGVYVTHYMVLWFLEKLGWFEQVLINPEFYLIATYTLAFIGACLVSSVTYVIIEAPFIDIRNKLLKSMKS